MWRRIPGLVFCLIVAVMLFATYKKSTNPQGEELIGRPAPELHSVKVEGFSRLPSRDVLFNGQYVLVNFFASWCTPCLAEHPHLQQLSEEFGLTIVGIAWRDSAENVQAMLDEHGNPYSYVGLDKMDASAYAYSVVGLPESFLIGPDGNVVATHRGPLLPNVIRTTIIPFLEERGAALETSVEATP